MQRRKFKACIFDLDGTLVDSPLDFVKIRSDLGIGASDRILESIDAVESEARKVQMRAILHEHEWQAAGRAKLIPGVPEFLQTLRTMDMPLALFTRNSRASALRTLQQTALHLDYVIAREDAAPKPSPEGLLKICRHWNLAPQEVLYFGDYLYDLEAGEAAGVPTVLFLPKGESVPGYAGRAYQVIQSYAEALALF